MPQRISRKNMDRTSNFVRPVSSVFTVGRDNTQRDCHGQKRDPLHTGQGLQVRMKLVRSFTGEMGLNWPRMCGQDFVIQGIRKEDI